MALRTHPLSLTASDQTVLTVPEGQEATCNNILCTGSGSLTLKYREATTGVTHTVFSGKSVTDEIALERSFNLSSGDQLIASGSGLSIFVSAYYVGSNSSSAALTYGPGPQTLQAGDMDAGYFGEVSAAEFYSGNRLALELGVTQGTLHNSDAGWLKFARKNKVLFIAKKTFMYSVTWDHLYSRGLVYGVDGEGANPSLRVSPTNQFTTVEYGGNRFLVRLMTGARSDPYPDSDPRYYTEDMVFINIGVDSEWGRLMYHVHIDIPTRDGTDGMNPITHGGSQWPEVNWANFSNADLNVGADGSNTFGDGSWCQESGDIHDGARVVRGAADIAQFSGLASNSSPNVVGWRPVLELIPAT